MLQTLVCAMRAMLPSNGYFFLWLAHLEPFLRMSAGATCLSQAIPEELRKHVGTTEKYPLGIWANDWAAGHLTSDVVQIIIQEILGFHAVRTGPGGGTVDGFFALVGCETPTSFSDRGCGEGPTTTRNHIVVEGWTESYMLTWMKIQQDYPDTAPKNLGNMGYFGKTSMYLSSEVQKRAWEAEGLNLEFYRGYNVSCHNAAAYFDPPSSLNLTHLKPCTETRLVVSEAMEFYAELTGDSAGIERVDGQVRGKCWDGYFWYPPSCRNSPSQCLPFLTAGTGWNLEETMQKATAWNMQVAPVVAATWKAFTDFPSQRDMTFYWWVPDPTFLHLSPVEITFPAFDRAAHSRGDKRTAPSSISIDKYVSKDLAVLAPEVEEFLKAFRIEMQMVNKMLLDQIETKDNSSEVACRWVNANENLWKSWLPDVTQCYAGFGLYHEATNQYVADRKDPSGLKCKACPSGTYSAEVLDSKGSTFACKPCAVGTAQPSGAALACDLCPPGEHQDEEGSSSCKRCGIGQYQHQKGQEKCLVCPQGTTTPGLSSSTLEDCGCAKDTIDIGTAVQPECVACGEGLYCPFAATLEGLKTGNATKSHLEVPRIMAGYHGTVHRPLELFKCHLERCPGGQPEQCGSGLQGLPCSECREGESWDGKQCGACSSWLVLGWVAVGFAALLALPAMYYINKRSATAKANLKQTAMICFNMIVSLAQVCALLGMMTIQWPGVFNEMTSGSQVLLLDLESSHVACIGGASPSFRYIQTVLVFPAAIAWLLLCLALSRCFPQRFQWKWAQTFNTMGALMQVAINMMSSLALQPFMCYHHPNGQESLVKYPGVLCGSEAHTVMKVAGYILLIVFVFGFLSIAAWAAKKIPTWGSNGQISRVHSFIFLIARFRMDRWWFGVPLLLRGPLLSLPVVWATDSPETQTSIAAFVVAIFLFLQIMAWPWKVPLLNVMDTWVTLWLLVLLLATPVYNTGVVAQTQLKEQFSVIFMAFIVLALFFVIAIIFIALCQYAITGNGTSKWLDLTILRGNSTDVTGEMLHQMAEELLQFSSRDLAWQMGRLNPHDVTRIEACIAILTSECGLTLGRTHGRALGLDRRIVAKATTRSSLAPSLEVVRRTKSQQELDRTDHNLDKQKEEDNFDSDNGRCTEIEDANDDELSEIPTEASREPQWKNNFVAVEL